MLQEKEKEIKKERKDRKKDLLKIGVFFLRHKYKDLA
jgi:hypothetical protein